MDERSNAAPVIIKRKKIIAGRGHHGGAWKVAYADFVTAMMAFFLLMWLLNATTEQQRKGIADYFSPTIPVNRISGGGSGAFGGDNVSSENVLAQNGTGATRRFTSEDRQARGDAGLASTGRPSPETDLGSGFSEIADSLAVSDTTPAADARLLRHVATRMTDEGFVIELFDLPGQRLFEAETATPSDILRQLVPIIGSAVELVKNRIALTGHTRALPVTLVHNPVWDLSLSRADMLRHMLGDEGVDPGRIRRMTGHADRDPATRNPMSLRNNRMELILLLSDRH